MHSQQSMPQRSKCAIKCKIKIRCRWNRLDWKRRHLKPLYRCVHSVHTGIPVCSRDPPSEWTTRFGSMSSDNLFLKRC